MQTDIDYYRERAAIERRMAQEASRAAVSLIHLELAKQYEGLVDQAELDEAVKAANPVLLWV